MGIKVQTRKKDGKYRFWTTIADGWLTDWLSRKQAVKFLQKRVMKRAQEECDKIEHEFPYYYFDMNSRMILPPTNNK